VSGGFSPLFHVGHEKTEADTHVESHDDVLSDAGSTPAASTNFPQEISEFSADFPAASSISPRLSSWGPAFAGPGLGFFQQPNRSIERCRAEVHVALRRLEVVMPGELLRMTRKASFQAGPPPHAALAQ